MKPYWYDLPQDRIAQRPVYPYDKAKLLVIDRQAESLQDSRFESFHYFLGPEDLLIFNNTRVMQARLFGEFQDTGGAVEVLLIERTSDPATWKAMGKPLKKFRPGRKLIFGNGFKAEIVSKAESECLIHFEDVNAEMLMNEQGLMPIPPYIRQGRSDQQDVVDYQPIFSENEGSIAAPTASLHFTPDLMDQIYFIGASVEFVTLHVGAASFLPLFSESDQLGNKKPLEERYIFSQKVMDKIIETKSRKGKVIAVGTTVVRALETMFHRHQREEGREYKTDLFITPGFEFKAVDALVTNFHQPGTTHMLLVEAFIGHKLLEQSYKHALENEYRFLSYGDGMLVL